VGVGRVLIFSDVDVLWAVEGTWSSTGPARAERLCWLVCYGTGIILLLTTAFPSGVEDYYSVREDGL
jgi:hypothetical protein